MGKRNIDTDDWRWYFQYLTPQYYTDCSYYSILLKNHIDQKSGIDEIELTDSQREDYKKYKYKCYYKINIIGKNEDLKQENYIEIDGNGIELSENNFLIFIDSELKSFHGTVFNTDSAVFTLRCIKSSYVVRMLMSSIF